MRPCRLALALFFFPLAFGCLLGVAIANSVLVALEDRERERREDAVTRETAWPCPDTPNSGLTVPGDGGSAEAAAIDICRVPADYSFEVN